MQHERRITPYPWTWEPAAAGVLVVVVLVVAGTHLGRFTANLLAGAGPTWPRAGGGLQSPGAVWSSLPAVLAGDSSAGLAHPLPTDLAGVVVTRICVATTLVVLFALATVTLVACLRRFGPRRMRGMATAHEVTQLLGTARLRRHRHVIRPDLASSGRRGPGSPGSRTGGRRSPLAWWQYGWRLGAALEPHAGDLWVPWDRTTGVIGPQGSGKTLDLLVPALLGAPGGALVTLTKPEDLLLSLTERASGGRPCLVLDPFGLVTGVPADLLKELVWDPVEGCIDAAIAERRAKAFTAGTISGAIRGGGGDDAARFFAAEAAKVLQSYLHAAALTGRSLDDVLRWVGNPRAATDPEEILRRHPQAEPFWYGLLRGSLHGDDRTAANTTATVQQAMGLFFQSATRARCVPGPGRPATDISDVIARGGTIYLLGRDDPYSSGAPLMTALAEHVLDTALHLAHASPWAGRLCPPFLACLDELPSTAPLPTLRTRMANERALGLSFIWAAQTRAQLTALFGEQETRALLGLTNVLTVFGGSKDVSFNQELSDLLGNTRVQRTSRNLGPRGGRTVSGEDIAVLRPEEIRRIPEGRALVVAEQARPIIARLDRAIDGKAGRGRLAAQRALRERLSTAGDEVTGADSAQTRALAEAARLGLTADRGGDLS